MIRPDVDAVYSKKGRCLIAVSEGEHLGWYSGGFEPKADGQWCTIAIDKDSLGIEDQPDLIADLEKGFQAAAEAR